ncbi:MAG: hypothetical protein V1733_04190 [bacterium]
MTSDMIHLSPYPSPALAPLALRSRERGALRRNLQLATCNR